MMDLNIFDAIIWSNYETYLKKKTHCPAIFCSELIITAYRDYPSPDPKLRVKA